MKRQKWMPRGPRGAGPVQVFSCGPFEFHIDKALKRAAGCRSERRWPNPEWVGPLIEINEDHIEQADLSQPVLFATLVTDGRPWTLLIDGNHRVLKAVRHGVQIDAITLDLADTLHIIRGPVHLVAQMRRDGKELGLLR